MARKPRDFKTEYAHRIEFGRKRGYSKARARGHRPSTSSASIPQNQALVERLELAYAAFQDTKNLSVSAKGAKVSPERFRAYLRTNKLVRKRGHSWSLLPDNRVRELEMLTTQGWKVVVVGGFRIASEIGAHRAAVKLFKDTGTVDGLAAFVGRAISETDGKSHLFETRPNVILRLIKTGRGSFEQVYKIVSR